MNCGVGEQNFIVHLYFDMPLFLEKSGAPLSRDQVVEIFRLLKTKNIRLPKNLLKMPVRSLKELNSFRPVNCINKLMKRNSNNNSFPFPFIRDRT